MRVEAAAAVGAYVQRERDRLVSREPLVRRDRPGAVKVMRTASRRLRSVWHALEQSDTPAPRATAPAAGTPAGAASGVVPGAASGTDPGAASGADPGAASGVRPGVRPGGLPEEFTWLNEHLGRVRHFDETAHRVAAHAPMTGRPARWTLLRLEESRGPARRELLAVLDGPRYRALVDELDARADAPVPQGAARGFGDWFCAAWPALVEDFAAAAAIADPETRADELHEVRKAAKPVLDTGRSVARAYPRLLRSPLRVLGALHDALGEHQDSTVCRRTVAPWADEAPDAEVREALRELTEHERAAAAAVEARLAVLHRELAGLSPGR
ncbi:CHAD domain-containing protein [Streptomyces sp. NPDC007369]|uniref:CHAD domain-containing protein n=1 Tax=Streptomyces sp. NPDC007369 TaxID=3154589 RepID=UPI0033E17C92